MPTEDVESSIETKPACAFVASSLLDVDNVIAFIKGAASVDPIDTSSERLRTGYRQLDEDVLRGGFRYGRGGIICISCDQASVERGDDLAYSTLTSHLLSNADGHVYHIDPLGRFSPFRLHKFLIRKLLAAKRGPAFQHTGGYVYTRRAVDNNLEEELEEQVSEEAAKIMDRVAVMRVFDFAGFMEAMIEIEERLYPQELEKKSVSCLQTQPETDKESLKPIATIQDSQEELGSDLGEDIPPQIPEPGQNQGEATESKGEKKPLSSSTRVLICIPSIHSLISPFMRTNHVRAHAEMLQLATALQRLTHSHAVCCLMFSSTVPATSSFPSSYSSSTTTLQRDATNSSVTASRPRQESGPSAFAVNGPVKPALGRTWPYCLDLNLLLTKPPLPTSQQSIPANRSPVTLEVLADRYSTRVGRWCTF